MRPEMAFAINGVYGAQQEAERRYNAADCDASSPCRVARAAGGVIATVGLGGAAIRGGFALAQYCFANPLVCNTLGIEVAVLVGGDALPTGAGTAGKIAFNKTRQFSGGMPSIINDVYNADIVNARSAEFYYLYGGNNPLRGTMSNLEARLWYLS